MGAEIGRLRDAHRQRDFRTVLDVAGDAEGRVELLRELRVARVGELAPRVLVDRVLQLLPVAALARLLQRRAAAERARVAALARKLDLVVAVARLARQEEAAGGLEPRVSRRALHEESRREIAAQRHAQHSPQDPVDLSYSRLSHPRSASELTTI
jgi:hypothetical protein